MSENPLRKLESFGQSIWLDWLRRGGLESGDLQRWIDEDGVGGLTSNPSIFEKAIAGSHDYDGSIRTMALEGKSIEEIYEAITVEDIQRAADLFRPTFDRLHGGDGFVSLEVSPKLAHDTDGTIQEARRLWGKVNRPNLFIKVPGTKEGLPAIRQLIGEGINVNITLLFGLPRYREVIEAYLGGLETLAAQGKPLDQVHSVASFFLSRIDVLVDPQLDQLKKESESEAEIAGSLHGQAAIASAKIAYQIYKEIFNGERFQELARKGARTQRVLWASTSTKNPQYSDVKYVEPLIGPNTINTVPIETLDAYRDHGKPTQDSVEMDVQNAREALEGLGQVGINIDQVTQQLEDEGVEKFDKALDKLMAAIQEKREASFKEPLDKQSFHLGEIEQGVETELNKLDQAQFSTRLWRKDASLWKSDPKSQDSIRNGLGWLFVAEKMEENLAEIEAFKAEVIQAGFEHAVVLGMGGSSLTPLVFERTFGWKKGSLPLTVLDSTDPVTIRTVEQSLNVKNTLFIVSSKSGTTAEPTAFEAYFYEQVKQVKGERACDNFCVITDPGTPLEKTARDRGYRKVFLNFPDIGGRYSALSYFGMVPAALMGVDVSELLARSLRMLHACYACVPIRENPGIQLGAALGELARDHQRYKVTFLMPDSLAPLGMWLEQLLAESTGKEGTGLLPVAGEPVGRPEDYGQDRVFVYIRMTGKADDALDKSVTALKEAGQPVVEIHVDDMLDLGQEFFRWEIATATAGAVLGINAFDQPNVQESKDNTNRLLAQVGSEGKLPEEKPALVKEPLKLYFEKAAANIEDLLCQFLTQARPEDYVALQAYIEENPENQQILQDIRRMLQEYRHATTTLGYGPRFLHSTGQFHKGGPNTGLFLQLTAETKDDLPIPEAGYTFGTFIQAQALGDLQALHKHGRRAGRIDLGTDVSAGLQALAQAIQAAMQPEAMNR